MTEATGKYPFGRRSFLRKAAVLGLSGAGASLAGLASVLPAFADAHDPESFVRRRGSNFVLRCDPFFFAGTNNYYLHYSSQFMIDDVLNNAVDRVASYTHVGLSRWCREKWLCDAAHPWCLSRRWLCALRLHRLESRTTGPETRRSTG